MLASVWGRLAHEHDALVAKFDRIATWMRDAGLGERGGSGTVSSGRLALDCRGRRGQRESAS